MGARGAAAGGWLVADQIALMVFARERGRELEAPIPWEGAGWLRPLGLASLTFAREIGEGEARDLREALEEAGGGRGATGTRAGRRERERAFARLAGPAGRLRDFLAREGVAAKAPEGDLGEGDLGEFTESGAWEMEGCLEGMWLAMPAGADGLLEGGELGREAALREMGRIGALLERFAREEGLEGASVELRGRGELKGELGGEYGDDLAETRAALEGKRRAQERARLAEAAGGGGSAPGKGRRL